MRKSREIITIIAEMSDLFSERGWKSAKMNHGKNYTEKPLRLSKIDLKYHYGQMN